MTEATQAPTPTVEQTLNKTDFGHMVYEYRKLFFGLLIAVLVAATGYTIWKQAQQSSALEDSEKVFKFQTTTWSEAKAGKRTPQELVSAFDGLDESTRNAPLMLPIVLEMSKFLYEKDLLTEAASLLGKVKFDNHPVSAFFISMQKAVVFEKAGKIDDAIAVLEQLAKGKEALMPGKVSLDLGRLYLLKGEKGKAQTQFEYVITNFPNEEQAKLAKLYMSQLK
ncbi:MAG TPA: tetratricopeptide repeat protein [Bacteriovoracaceae bacterium]|nr:tetratricopeptide repeat protein [Bacteriovoracaceae bacterium]